MEPPCVSYSCIAGDRVWPGTGNINQDPLFCGWATTEERVGDQNGLENALSRFSLALSSESPCIGTGEGGANMGADTGVCERPGEAARVVHVAPGTYAIDGLSLTHNVSLVGAGEEETVIEGTVLGLRTGAVLSHLTVRHGGGIRVSAGEAPEILHCVITGNRGYDSGGVCCGSHSSPTLISCTISGNSGRRGGGALMQIETSTR